MLHTNYLAFNLIFDPQTPKIISFPDELSSSIFLINCIQKLKLELFGRVIQSLTLV